MEKTTSGTGVTWRSLPMVDDWPRSMLGPAVVFLACTLIAVAFGIVWAALGFVILIVSLRQFFFPTIYELTPEGVEVRFLGSVKHKPWSFYSNYYPHDIGVHLTPLDKPGALDAFRGHFVRFSGNRDEVLGYIAEHISRA